MLSCLTASLYNSHVHIHMYDAHPLYLCLFLGNLTDINITLEHAIVKLLSAEIWNFFKITLGNVKHFMVIYMPG